MRRSRVRALPLACAFLALSCAERLWSTPREVIPRSYQRALPGTLRSIGRLRRLVLPEVLLGAEERSDPSEEELASRVDRAPPAAMVVK